MSYESYGERAERRKVYQKRYNDAHREMRRAYYADPHRREKYAERQRKLQSGLSAFLSSIRVAQGCRDCGRHDGPLLHHHLDPSTKRYEVTKMVTCSMESIVDEIAKCTVLCYSCHKKLHNHMRRELATP